MDLPLPSAPRGRAPNTLPCQVQDPGDAVAAVWLVDGGEEILRSAERRRTLQVLHRYGLATLVAEGGAADPEALLRTYDAWIQRPPRLPVGLLGLGSGALAAWSIARRRPGAVAGAVLVASPLLPPPDELARFPWPLLLVVGGLDAEGLRVHRDALHRAGAGLRLEVVPGCTRRFDSPGALETLAHLAGDWFADHLPLHRSA